MRIALLTHYYEPEIGAPQKRWSGLIREFVGRGHSVAVCAPVAHYPHRSASALAIAHQPLWTWRDGRNGERVLRVPYAPTSGSLPGQLFDQTVSSAASGVALMAMRRNPPDVIVSTTPGLPMPFAAAAVASALRVPHVAEVRDAWPDLIKDASLIKQSLGGRVPAGLANWLETEGLPGIFHSALRRADALVTTTESFADQLRARSMPPVTVVRNTSAVSGDALPPPSRSRGSGLNILYAGTVGRSQGLDAVVRVVAALDGVRLRIVGAGAQWDELRAAAAGTTDRIEFYPQMSGEDLEAQWAWAHTGLVSLAENPSFERTIPSKLVSIMARGMHVTGVVAGEAAQVIHDSAAGRVVRPGDEEALKRVLSELRDDPRTTVVDERPRQWVREHASPEAAAQTYLRLLQDVIR